MVTLMFLVIITVGYLQLFYNPQIDKKKRLDHTIQTKVSTLSDMMLLKSEYLTLIQRSERLKNYYNSRPKNFTLFSFLERLAGETRIKNNIAHMKPSTKSDQNESRYRISQVELKLENVTLPQLTSYLYKIETSDNMVSINKMSISKKRPGALYINVLLQVVTWELNTR